MLVVAALPLGVGCVRWTSTAHMSPDLMLWRSVCKGGRGSGCFRKGGLYGSCKSCAGAAHLNGGWAPHLCSLHTGAVIRCARELCCASLCRYCQLTHHVFILLPAATAAAGADGVRWVSTSPHNDAGQKLCPDNQSIAHRRSAAVDELQRAFPGCRALNSERSVP